MFFGFGRSEGYPTQYEANRTPVTVDILDAGFILAAVILAVSFYVSMIQIKIVDNICMYSRVTLSIFIGVVIIQANFGQEWEVGHIISKTPYKAGSGEEINANIGIKIGLRSVNITLKAIGDLDPNGTLKHEVIDYNERFHWTWDQGRFGFGPYAGRLQREFREAQYKGVPTPILWIVDYFVIDGEGFRHGRFYRTAGWYSHIAMWSAFPCWLLANIFFRSVIRYGGYWLGLAGILQLLANLLWCVIRNPVALVIPFEDETITTKFGLSYWLTFFCGILCLVLSIAIYIGEYWFTEYIHFYFGVDPLTSTDEIYFTEEEYYHYIGTSSSPKVQNDDVPLVDMKDLRGTSVTRQMVVHFRRNTKSVVWHRHSVSNREAIYGNVEPTDKVAEEDNPEYDNVLNPSSVIPARPPPPPRRRN